MRHVLTVFAMMLAIILAAPDARAARKSATQVCGVRTKTIVKRVRSRAAVARKARRYSRGRGFNPAVVRAVRK